MCYVIAMILMGLCVKTTSWYTFRANKYYSVENVLLWILFLVDNNEDKKIPTIYICTRYKHTHTHKHSCSQKCSLLFCLLFNLECCMVFNGFSVLSLAVWTTFSVQKVKIIVLHNFVLDFMLNLIAHSKYVDSAMSVNGSTSMRNEWRFALIIS